LPEGGFHKKTKCRGTIKKSKSRKSRSRRWRWAIREFEGTKI
jgi:hypothetical protein